MENIRYDIQEGIGDFLDIFSVPKFVPSIDYIDDFYPHLSPLQRELWDKVHEKSSVNQNYVQMNWYNEIKYASLPNLINK